MSKPNAREADKRVPVALGLMAAVLALLGAHSVSLGDGGAMAGQPIGASFAAAAAPER